MSQDPMKNRVQNAKFDVCSKPFKFIGLWKDMFVERSGLVTFFHFFPTFVVMFLFSSLLKCVWCNCDNFLLYFFWITTKCLLSLGSFLKLCCERKNVARVSMFTELLWAFIESSANLLCRRFGLRDENVDRIHIFQRFCVSKGLSRWSVN